MPELPDTAFGSPETAAGADVLVARQPIYDASMNVVAYELIVRSSGGDRTLRAGGTGASAGTVTEIGLNLVSRHPAYVKVSREFVLEGYARALPAERVVFEVTPEVGTDGEVVAALRELAREGYALALDGFRFEPEVEPLLALATTVKLDAEALERGSLREQVSAMRRDGVQLLAHNVESHEDFEFCESLGFDLYQGYFFCKPRVVEGGRGLEVNSLNRVRLIAELQAPDVEFGDLEQIVSRDVGLSYNLLRFVNSAFFSIPRRVGSIREALVMLGLQNVKKWSTLMALADTQDKPDELLVTGLVRARMCELIAADYGEADTDGYFTTGLFSIVDALMDASLVEVLASLPFSQEVIQALLRYDGPKGEVLRGVLAYEQGNMAELGTLRPTSVPLSELYAQAVEWAGEAGGGLGAPPPDGDAG